MPFRTVALESRRRLTSHHARCKPVAGAMRRLALVGGDLLLAQLFPRAAGQLLRQLIGGGPSADGADATLIVEAAQG